MKSIVSCRQVLLLSSLQIASLLMGAEAFAQGDANEVQVGREALSIASGTDNTVAMSDDGSEEALYAGASMLALASNVEYISLKEGGQQLLTLDGGSTRAGWFYIMLGSVHGTTPGVNFGGGVSLPLNVGCYFSATLNKPGLKLFGNFRGTLDGSGQAQATFTIPPLTDPVFSGVTIHHAYLAGSVSGIPEFASNAVPLTLVQQQPDL